MNIFTMNEALFEVRVPSMTSTWRIWSMESVRSFCIHHDYYTRGTNSEYERMLDYVAVHAPAEWDDIFKVALDIFYHSDLDDELELDDENKIIFQIAVQLLNEATKTGCAFIDPSTGELLTFHDYC